MSEWKKIKNIRSDVDLYKRFLVVWRGAVALAEYNEDQNNFWLCLWPATDLSFTQVAAEGETTITHWMPLPTAPEDF